LSRSGIYGWKYALNPYRGCEHNCQYCYAPNIIRTSRSSWGKFVEAKKNIPTILAKELKRLSPELVGISSVTDPYQELEEKYRLTQYCLEQLLKFKFPVSIITKSPLILRDIELLKRFSYSEITITITTLDEKLSQKLEPNAPRISKRLRALTKLSNEGLNTYAFLGPLFPTLEPHSDQVSEFMDRIFNTGVKSVMVDGLNLKPGIWPSIKFSLRNHPEILKVFQTRIFNDKDYYQNIFKLIETECKLNNVNFES
jgi:DNA repair photolyase